MAYGIIKQLVFQLVNALFIKNIEGLDNLPKKGPYLIVSNHSSYIDPTILSSSLIPKINEKIYFIAWFKLFKWWSKPFLKWFGTIKQDHGVEKAVELLKQKKIVAMFPEGERTRTGKIKRIEHTGAAVIVILSKTKIVPIAIKGAYELWPMSRKLPHLKRIVEIKIGKPIKLKHKNIPPKRTMLKELNHIMKQIDNMKNA